MVIQALMRFGTALQKRGSSNFEAPLLAIALLGAACGGGNSNGWGTDAPSPTEPPSGVPLIGDVLSCGEVGTAGSLATGEEMQRAILDEAAFPDALCNDGTRAVLYFRPHRDELSVNRWLIQLQGGGLCRDPDECAQRWCHEGTAFSMIGMTSSLAPEAINGNGIMAVRSDNPFSNWNHVFIRYCSSDQWTGTARDVVVTAEDPAGGGPRTFRLHFLGSAVVDATIATLRRVGVSALSFSLDGSNTRLPDLDDAEVVVLAGASAGGAGVAHQLDQVAALLAPTRVLGLIDSSFAPALETVDFSTSTACTTQGACSYEAYVTMVDRSDEMWGLRPDVSCVAWHETNDGGAVWSCEDELHVMLHHLGTPFFVRMGQRDELQSATYVGESLGPGGAPAGDVYTVDSFAADVREQAAALSTIADTAHEGDALTILPGAFVPSCEDHEILRDNGDVFGVTIEQDNTTYSLLEVFQRWVNGDAVSRLVTPPGGVETCQDD